MEFPRIHALERGFDDAEDRLGIDGEFAMENPAGNFDGETDKVLLHLLSHPESHAQRLLDTPGCPFHRLLVLLCRFLCGSLFRLGVSLPPGLLLARVRFRAKLYDAPAQRFRIGQDEIGGNTIRRCGAGSG
jgi:hypothetical protein